MLKKHCFNDNTLYIICDVKVTNTSKTDIANIFVCALRHVTGRTKKDIANHPVSLYYPKGAKGYYFEKTYLRLRALLI